MKHIVVFSVTAVLLAAGIAGFLQVSSTIPSDEGYQVAGILRGSGGI